jgi:hypothetical protein
VKPRLVVVVALCLAAQFSSAEPLRSSRLLSNNTAAAVFTTSERSGYFNYVVIVTDHEDDERPMAESCFCAWLMKGHQAIVSCLPADGTAGSRTIRRGATLSVVWSIDPPSKGSSAIRARVETSVQRPTITAYVQITTLAPAKVTLQ